MRGGKTLPGVAAAGPGRSRRSRGPRPGIYAEPMQFSVLVEWLLWPGVALMVCATLATLAARLWRNRRLLLAPGGGGWKTPRRF